MISSTLYYRIVPQERGRGWMLLISWVKPVVQRTCLQLITLQGVTEKSLEERLNHIKNTYGASEVRDETPPAVLRSLIRECEKAAAALLPPVTPT
jgi:hypothetical protein